MSIYFRHTFANGCVAILMSLSLSACNRSAQQSELDLLNRAKAFQKDGKTQSQVIELKNLLQKNPNHPEARWLLGEAYSALGYGRDAEKELVRAQELGIDPEVIKIPLGKSILDQGDFKRVLNEIRPGPKSSTRNIAAIKTLYGQAEVGLKKFETGCGLFREAQETDATYIPAYWESARCSLGFGKPLEAEEEVAKAIKLDEKNIDSWRLQGDLLRNQKKLAEAEKAYSTGLSHRPDNLETLIARAAVRVHLDNHKGATEDLAAVTKQVPAHPLVFHLKGIMLYKEKKYIEAKASFESVLRTNPDYAPTILWLGLTDYALNNLEQAVHGLARYVSAVPGAPQVQAVLAVAKARLGGKSAAAETLAMLDKLDVNDPQSLALIGQAHLLAGDNDAGSRYLARAVEKNPGATDPRVNLVAALLQKGDAPAAVSQAEEIYKKAPDDPRAAAILISALIETKQLDRALEVIAALEKKLPNTPYPYMFRAAINGSKNDLDAARVDLEHVWKLQPGHPLAGHSLAAIAIKQNKLDDARRYYRQVREKNRDPMETIMAEYDLEVHAKQSTAASKLVEFAAKKYPKAAWPATIIATAYTALNSPAKAIQLSNTAADANPDDVELLKARGAAFFESGDLANALNNFKRIARLRPDLAEGHAKLGLVHLANRDSGAARDAFQRAVRIDPKHIVSRLSLADLDIQDKKWNEAIKRAKEVETEFPQTLEAYVLQSTAYAGLKQDAEAIAVLRRAEKMIPNEPQPVIELAKLHFNANAGELGFKTLKSWLTEHPDNVPVSMFLGETLMAYKKDEEAIAIYDKVLSKAPNNIMALNNLANLLTDRDPKRGLKLAEQAHSFAPIDADIIDTYGWLQLKNGNTAKALELLKKAFEIAPNSPEIHFHLATTMAKSGDKAQAKRELENLLSAQKGFPSRKDAEALLQQL
jgi:putative PEP-CTERM system TPR-repeat lipoprotein